MNRKDKNRECFQALIEHMSAAELDQVRRLVMKIRNGSARIERRRDHPGSFSS